MKDVEMSGHRFSAENTAENKFFIQLLSNNKTHQDINPDLVPTYLSSLLSS